MDSYTITDFELYDIVVSGDDEERSKLKDIVLEGWVKTNRDNGSIGFIEFNDGTYFKNVQLVYNKECKDYSVLTSLKTGAAIIVKGDVSLTPGNKQPFEVIVSECRLEGDVADDYPLQKKKHSFEFLRDIAHIRPRANTFQAIFRVRSVLSMALHEFFQERGFIYVHTPLITTNDGEGAGNVFDVTTHDTKDPNSFYGQKVNLTVTGQLHVEPFALAFRDVYTFGPAFRAEHSNTTRHASEFWMVEPEIAFADLQDDMNLIEDCVKFCINYLLVSCPAEMEFFNTMIDKTLFDRLHHVLDSKFQVMTYTEGVELLKKAVQEGQVFENSNIVWGMDLQSEHERYLTEKVVDGPLFLINYPKEIKAFYMRQNDDGKTVAACDLLVPAVGELVGGSQREERYDVLKNKMDELGLTKGLEWYLDTRRYGGCKHAGFGLGFDRLLMYVTGMSNIRDVQPYPRTFNTIKY
ncbi:MAG TPA: asparagine--tRNA ligase [Bacilli bacterium]|nr:asparagine--tRNA ligase [Bacilli bacterium]HPS18919.1 asparagine--tRNA ligase [Bacilli bacterium]